MARNEFHYFKTACGKRTGASAAECGTGFYSFLVGVRAEPTVVETIEALWP